MIHPFSGYLIVENIELIPKESSSMKNKIINNNYNHLSRAI